MSTLSIHKRSLLFAASFLFVLTINTPPAAAQECCEVSADPNTVTNPQAGETLGTSVAVDGGTAVAGAPFFDFSIGEQEFLNAGRAIVFNFTGSSWVQVDELRPLDADADDRFWFVRFNIGMAYAIDRMPERALGAFRQLLDHHPGRVSDIAQAFASSPVLRKTIESQPGFAESLLKRCPELFQTATQADSEA